MDCRFRHDRRVHSPRRPDSGVTPFEATRLLSAAQRGTSAPGDSICRLRNHGFTMNVLHLKRFNLALIVMLLPGPAHAVEPAFRIAEGLFDATQPKTLGLKTIRGETTLLYKATKDTYRFCHHPNLIVFGDRLYCMWSNGKIGEDEPGQRILYAGSDDGTGCRSQVARSLRRFRIYPARRSIDRVLYGDRRHELSSGDGSVGKDFARRDVVERSSTDHVGFLHRGPRSTAEWSPAAVRRIC